MSQSHGTTPSVISLGKHPRPDETIVGSSSTVQPGEALVTASVGSNEDLDHLDEDLTRTQQSRDTGYFGQNSEVQWLRSVQRQTEHPGAEPQGQPRGPPGSGRKAVGERSDALHQRRDDAKHNDRQGSMKHITDSTFYLDSESLDINDILVDPLDVPEPDHAERLFNCYMETVHSSFPLVSDPLY
jgi:hypothetical protein